MKAIDVIHVYTKQTLRQCRPKRHIKVAVLNLTKQSLLCDERNLYSY